MSRKIKRPRAITSKGIDRPQKPISARHLNHNLSVRPPALVTHPGDVLNLTSWAQELEDMKDVLEGRVEPPVNMGTSTMLEIADAYYGRASEMTMQILRLERLGEVDRKSQEYRFRTGELRTFLDRCKRAGDLGSRRVTVEQMELEASRTGRSRHVDDEED